jgi:hypothetical protein
MFLWLFITFRERSRCLTINLALEIVKCVMNPVDSDFFLFKYFKHFSPLRFHKGMTYSMITLFSVLETKYSNILLFEWVVVGYELRASGLLSRHSTT